MRRIIIVIFIIVIAFIGFLLFRKSQQPATTTVTQVKIKTMPAPGQAAVNFTALNSAQLATMLQQKNFFLVNVHTPYEGEIENTDAFIPYDKIADNLEKLPQDKNAKIVLYCRSGRMSEIAAQELARLGYTQVAHLSGGMISWKNNGYEIIKK
ncbi:rhodanese-like domain-containing protein [Candidatus Kaiserbacteria bacterium]|nr:rhodanese-like domain-containing protein [Candidatus Kaiserbacteria bacterium]